MGKRKAAEVEIEKQASAKKQKRDVGTENAVEKPKSETKTQKKTIKKVESSSSEVKVTPKKVPTKPPVKESSGNDDSSSDEEVTVKAAVPSKKRPVAASKNAIVASPAKKANSEEDDSDLEGAKKPKSEVAVPSKVPLVTTKKGTVGSAMKKVKSGDDSESGDSDSSDDDAPATRVAPAKRPSSTTKTKKREEEIRDVVEPKTEITQADKKSGGSKTLFVGNLSISVEEDDVETFFKDFGEVQVHLGVDSEGARTGFGHVEFATEEAAQKALKWDGEDLSGRRLILDLAKESYMSSLLSLKLDDEDLSGRHLRLDLAKKRSSHTPSSGEGSTSSQGEGRSQGPTIFVRGFDKNGGEDQVRSALEEHFSTCGGISVVSLPKESGKLKGKLKGIAFIDFTDIAGSKKALKLGGSKLGGHVLKVEEAKPTQDSHGCSGSGQSGGSRGGGSSGGGNRGGGSSGSRSGGSSGGGRFGGRDGGDLFGGRGGGCPGRGRSGGFIRGGVGHGRGRRGFSRGGGR